MIGEQQQILEVIYGAIDDINRQLPAEQRLAKTPTTELYTESSNMDSLGLVNLILSTEERLEDAFGVSISISDQSVISRASNPFRTVQTLADFIEGKLRGAA
ncbi:MAG: hypothetical protein IPK19_05690 [Chloroflexi bacterium]|nr:hypothetical protein [Chloroflexota bacterium]